jgi:hypothetical protein
MTKLFLSHLIRLQKSGFLVTLSTLLLTTLFVFGTVSFLQPVRSVQAASSQATLSSSVTPLSPNDLAFLRSLVSHQAIQIPLGSTSTTPSLTQTFDNVSKIQAALKNPHLSAAMRSAIELIPTSVVGSTASPSTPLATPHIQPNDASCTKSATADFKLTAKNLIGLPLWTYEVAQTFFVNQNETDICSYFGRNPIVTVPSAASLSNETGDIGSCCPTNVGVLIVQNNAYFTTAVPALINATLVTNRGNILFKFHSDGTWEAMGTVSSS